VEENAATRDQMDQRAADAHSECGPLHAWVRDFHGGINDQQRPELAESGPTASERVAEKSSRRESAVADGKWMKLNRRPLSRP